MKLRAGRLRHRLRLQKKTESRSSTGAVTAIWTTDSTVWGSIEPLSGREFIAAGGTQNEADVRIIIRYHATITDDWRVWNDSKAYTILAVVNEDERDRMMELRCSQGVAEQLAATDSPQLSPV